MNLVTEPWIPVRIDSSRQALSLHEVFERAESISDVSVRPLERVSLYRLLLCIAQRALDGPVDAAAWKTARERLIPASLEYLNRTEILAALQMFGDGPCFLQPADLDLAKGKTLEKDGAEISKLDFTLASGNNSRLFDNGATPEREASAAHAALWLLTFQCFSPGGLMPVARWSGKDTRGAQKPAAGGKVSGGDAPCLSGNMIHSWLRGTNLLTTLHCNLLTKEKLRDARIEWGEPVWESFPSGPGDNATTQTYLGRLVPVSRAIRLFEDDRARMILSNGLNYPFYPEFREPNASTWLDQKKNERRILGARKGRAIWRDLHSIVTRNRDGRALNLDGAKEAAESLDLVVTALVTTNAKFEEVVESVFALVPAQQLPEGGDDRYDISNADLPLEEILAEPDTEDQTNEKFQAVYERGVQIANSWELRLRNGVAAYQKDLMSEGSWRDKASHEFWSVLETKLPLLIRWATVRIDETQTDWRKTVSGTAQEAYRRTCPADTPRQLQAFAAGRRAMFPKLKTPK